MTNEEWQVTKTRYSVAPPLWQQPTAQQMRLLQASLGEGEPALSAWQAWRASADLDHLPPGGFGLLPLLAHNLQRHGVTDPLLNKCQGIHRQVWSRNQLHLSAVLPLCQRMNEAGILPIVYADTALMLFHYPQSGLRAVDAIHLATRGEQTVAMNRLLREGGWQQRPTRSRWWRPGGQTSNRPQLFASGQGTATLLQWQPLSADDPTLITCTASDGGPLTMQGVIVGCLSPTALLLDTCARGIVAQHRYGAVQWIADAVMLLRHAQPPIDWTHLLARTSQTAVTLRMRLALHALHAIIDTPIPAPVLAQLQTLPIQSFERWEVQLPDRLPTAVRSLLTRWVDRQRNRCQQDSEHTRFGGKVAGLDVLGKNAE